MPSRKLSKTKWDQTDSPPQGHHDQTDAGKAPGRAQGHTDVKTVSHSEQQRKQRKQVFTSQELP